MLQKLGHYRSKLNNIFEIPEEKDVKIAESEVFLQRTRQSLFASKTKVSDGRNKFCGMDRQTDKHTHTHTDSSFLVRASA